VAGAADALQAAGDGLGGLDLQDEVHGAHVDAELERRGGHQARQLARLEQLLDHGALLPGERAVVGARDVSTCAASSCSSRAALCSSLRRSARRSAPRRLLTKTMVERCSWTSLSSSG
jgi:hypothetical protein